MLFSGLLVKDAMWILYKYYTKPKLVSRKKIEVYEAEPNEFNSKASEKNNF